MMSTIENAILNRTRLLVGDEAMSRIADARVIVFGIGGVGSWCAESLLRSGIRHITLVDSDRVCITNVNRQAMATTATVGNVKVDAMRERLLLVNPNAEITVVQEIYSRETAQSFHIEDYDFVIDAIDSLSNKMELILHATSVVKQSKKDEGAAGRRVHFFSAMGAALKMDPTKIKVSEFWDIDGCPLARALRKRMKSQERFPASKFSCVWSPEVLANKGGEHQSCGTAACMCPKSENGAGRADLLNHEWCTSKAQINGSMAHITAIFGFTLAGLVMQELAKV